MSDDKIDISDLESFITGLQTSLDMLNGADPTQSKGFQAQLAKTISALRIKRTERFVTFPKILGNGSNRSVFFILNAEIVFAN